MNKKITKATITYPWHLLLVLLYFFGSREQDTCAAHMAFSDKLSHLFFFHFMSLKLLLSTKHTRSIVTFFFFFALLILMTFDNFADKLMHLLSANVHVNQAKWSKYKFSRAALCRNLILPITKTIKRRLGCVLIFFFTFLTTLMGTAFFLFVCMFCLWAKFSVTVVYLIITLLLVLKLILIGTTMK